MSFYTGTPNAGGLPKVRSAIGSFFQDLFNTNEQATNPVPNSYQVGPDDTSLDQVATNLNVPLQQLVDNNDGARTLPPVGSFMTVQGPALPPGYGAGATLNNVPAGALPTSYNPQNYGPASVASQNGGRGSILPTAGDNTARGAYFTNLEVNNATTMLQNGQLPQQITGAAAAQLINPQTGQPFTPADFESEGYRWDGSRYTRAAVTPTTPAANTPVSTSVGTGSAEFMNTGFMQKNAANNTAFTKQLRWDPERKRYVQIGTLIKEGRLNVRDPRARLKPSKKGKKKQVAVAAPVPEASNAGDTPTQQLALVLGSG